MSQAVLDLSARITVLHESLKQTIQLIQRLSTFQTTTDGIATESSADGSPLQDENEADLASDIHDTLNQLEQDLELLKLDIEDMVPAVENRNATRRGGEREREGNNLLIRSARLTEDIELQGPARVRFRKAQLQAKRNADRARERERTEYLESLQAAANSTKAEHSEADHEEYALSHAEMRTSLFARRGPARHNGSSNATKDDMVLTASSDLTISLRRTHALLSNEVSRSRFAHETLASSNAALQELNTRYGALDDLLSRSRGLLGTLLKSQKTDTWYLQTAMYLLLATIGWLLFRRLLYGPMWWFVWFPVRTGFKVTSWGVGGAAHLAGGVAGGAAHLAGSAAGGAYHLASKQFTAKTMAISVTPSQVVSVAGTTQPPTAEATATTIAAQDTTVSDEAPSTDTDESNPMSDMVARMVEASRAMVGGTETAENIGTYETSTTEPLATSLDEVEFAEATPAADSEQHASEGEHVASGASEQYKAPRQAQAGGHAQPVRAGDGHVLRERDPVAEPVNPKKRMWEEPPPAQQQGEQQREL